MNTIKQATLLFVMVFMVSLLAYSQTTPLSVNALGSRITCNGANNGSINTIVRGGTSPYSYLWSNNATTSSINGLAPGVYTVQVTDAASSTANASYTITQPAMLNAFIDNTDISCNGGSDGTASPININGGSSIQVKMNSPNVAIFNATGALFGPSVFNVTANVAYIPDTSATFSGCNPYPAGSLTGKIALIDRLQTSDCFFVVKVQNAQNAGAIGVIIVNIGTFNPITMAAPPGGGTTITIPSVMIGGFDANPIKAMLANGTVVDASLKSGNQYAWSNGGTSSTITGLSAGTYSLTVTDLNGCTAVSNSVVLTNPPALSLTTTGVNLTCNNSNDGAASANVTGGNLNCRVTNLSPRTSGAIGRLFGLLPGNPPRLVITGQNFVACNTGFITAIRVYLGGVNTAPIIVPLSLSPGSSTEIPAYTQMVTLPPLIGFFIINLTTPFPVVGGSAYSFSLGGAGSTGFTALNYSSIDYPGGNVFTENNVQRPTDDLAFEVKISGTANFPYTYLWSNGATTNSINGLAAGNYSVTVTDAKGCTNSGNITLTQPDPLTVDAGPNKIVYKGFPDSACTRLQSSAPTGGTAPYTLTWSNGSHASFIDVCPEVTTTYYLNVTDANGCTFTDSVKVCVLDVRCGNKLDKVTVSHRTGSASNPCVTICVDINGAREHFRNHPGDQLGACGMVKECNWPGEQGLITLRAPVAEKQQLAFDNLLVYPNPSAGNTTIRFKTAKNDYVSIKLVDITGKEISRLYTGATDAGATYTVPVHADKLMNGIYLVIMNTNRGPAATRKLILSK